jgi:hypothetical protein
MVSMSISMHASGAKHAKWPAKTARTMKLAPIGAASLMLAGVNGGKKATPG